MPRILLGLSKTNPPISVAAPKPLSSNIDSISVFPSKTPSVASLNVYPTISLKVPETFGGGINSKSMNSSLSGEVSLLKVGSFSFGSPVSASIVSEPSFGIKDTEDKNKVHPLKREHDQDRISLN